jgi:hypothetical protein
MAASTHHLKKQLATFLVIILGLSACIKQDDFKFDDPSYSTWRPDIALPLVNSDLTMDDILGRADSGSLEIDSATDRVILIYEGNVYSVTGEDFLPLLDQQDVGEFRLSPTDSAQLVVSGNVTRQLTQDFLFNVANGETLDSVRLKSGTLAIGLTNSAPHGGIFRVSIPAARKNGISLDAQVQFTPSSGGNSTASGSIDLSGYTIDFTTGSGTNRIEILYEATWENSSSSQPCVNLPLSFTVDYDQLRLSAAFGDFGQRSLSVSLDSSELTIFQNTLGGTIHFDEPRFVFNIRNGFGMPVRATLQNLVSIPRTGPAIPIVGSIPNPLPVGVPGAPGLIAATSFVLDKNNSNVQTVVNARPEYISYDVDAVTNVPAGARNFLLDTSRLNVDLRVELPLVGYANGLTVQDTADFELENMREIESAVFRIYTSNRFPAQSWTQVYFTDSLYRPLDSLLQNPADGLVPAGITNAQGIVISPTVKTHDEPFDRPRLDRLFEARKLLIRGLIDTRNAPLQSVEIHSDNRLLVKIGVRAQLKVDFR